MAKLVLSSDGVITKEFLLEQEVFNIGRKSQNDIQIDDISVSGTHARVLVEQNFYMENLKDVYIEDANSTNGTYVNGNKMKKPMLRHGDMIQIGRHEFKFLDDDAPDFDKTVVISPTTQDVAKEPVPGPVPEAEAAPVSADTPPPAADKPEPQTNQAVKLAYVKVLSGPKAGKELDLVKSYTSMGNAGTMIVIAKRQQGYFVSHVSGKSEKHGSFPTVNENPVGAQSVPLQDHDIIDIDGLKLEFAIR